MAAKHEGPSKGLTTFLLLTLIGVFDACTISDFKLAENEFQCSPDMGGPSEICPPSFMCISGRCRLRCEATQCPSEFECKGGFCLPASGAGDAAAPADMLQSLPDAAPAVAGCASGAGTKLGKNAYACPGVFKRGSAAGLCKAPYAVASGGSGIDLNLCRTLGGFFGADSFLKRQSTDPDPKNFTCSSPPQAGQTRLVSGCGASRPSKTFDLTTPCQGFQQARDCSADATWQCLGQTAADLANDEPTSGVICAL